MKKMEAGDPGIFKLRSETHGCLVLFGAPFLFVGVWVIAGAAGVIPMETPEEPLQHALMYPFGTVFVLIGLGLMLGRRGLVIDRRRRMAVSWFGLVVPMKITEHRLDELQRVAVRRESHSSNGSRTIVFPVRLEGPGGKTLEIEKSQDYQRSRQLAEDVAKHLALPLSDWSSGEEVVREAAHLDESIREQVQRTGEQIELPSPPPAVRSAISQRAGAVSIDIPAEGLGFRDFAESGVTAVFIITASIFFGGILIKMPIPNQLRIALLVFFLVVFVVLPLVLVTTKIKKRKTQTTRVTVSPTKLTVVHGKMASEIPAHELEELSITGHDLGRAMTELPDGRLRLDRTPADGRPSQPQVIGAGSAGLLRTLARFAPGNLVQARSDSTTITFGRGLDLAELVYLHALVKKVLTLPESCPKQEPGLNLGTQKY